MTEIIAYRTPLSPVVYFKYLVRVLSESEKNWTAVVRNIEMAQQKWAQQSMVLGREGTDTQSLKVIYENNISGGDPGCPGVWVGDVGDDNVH